MVVAIATTKIPILLDRGFWAMAHDARTNWSMILGLFFLLIAGAGPHSLDARPAPKLWHTEQGIADNPGP